MDNVVLIPAAGRGSRLGSDRPKALVPVNGMSMIEHLLRLYAPIADRFVIVVAPGMEDGMARACAALPCAFDIAFQREPTGMLDAILAGYDRIMALRPQRVWVTWCDQIAVHPDTVGRLRRFAGPPFSPALAMPTVLRREPYIHLERAPGGRITRVLQRREGDAMPASGESDMGLFNLSLDAYRLLPEFAHEAAVGAGTGERNFLPFIAWLQARADVITIPATDPMESVGINTPDELARISVYLATPRIRAATAAAR
jgi:molybdopterin-guanine dinucleotide biosynthesis protein A